MLRYVGDFFEKFAELSKRSTLDDRESALELVYRINSVTVVMDLLNSFGDDNDLNFMQLENNSAVLLRLDWKYDHILMR